jgi:glycosyltransferase involved in cell wall biosynthesis
VVRLLAGALATRADVEVVALDRHTLSGPTGTPARTHADSVFLVHEMAASKADPAHTGLLRAALARTPGRGIPAIAGPRLVELGGGWAGGVGEMITALEADSVVLAGPETWWLPEALRSAGATGRLVSLPLLGDDPAGDLRQFRPLATEVDAVGVVSRAEARRFTRPDPDRARSDAELPTQVVELDVAFPVNMSVSETQLVGMADVGRFVVVMTGFPAGSPAAAHSPGHDYVRRALGPVTVAEVALDRWLISSSRSARIVPVKPSRPNLWRLLHNADVCLDLRPQGVVGRETLESLLLGTPVVVPEGTVAAEHAERSNGGLWYRDYQELFDAGRAIVDDQSLRTRLGAQGREWAAKFHGDQDRFSEQVAQLVLP